MLVNKTNLKKAPRSKKMSPDEFMDYFEKIKNLPGKERNEKLKKLRLAGKLP